MDNMTPKERIWATINRQPVDRPPARRPLVYTRSTRFTPEIYFIAR